MLLAYYYYLVNVPTKGPINPPQWCKETYLYKCIQCKVFKLKQISWWAQSKWASVGSGQAKHGADQISQSKWD